MKCKNLFLESRDFSDNGEFMNDFVELIKEWVKWNRGEVRILLIDLQKHKFKDGYIYIAYDDMSGAMNPTIYSSLEFIELIIDTYEEYDDQEYLDEFWTPKLQELIKKYD